MSKLPYRTRLILGFILVFVLYQSAEGLGARLLHNPIVASGFMVASVVAAWLAGRWLGYKGYDAYALDPGLSSLRLVATGLVLAGAVRLAAVFWGLASGVYSFGAPPAAQEGFALIGTVGGALISTFIPSLAEDILTRGFWLKAARIKWASWAFIFASSAIYVLNHIYKYGDGPMELLRLFCFGLAYAAAAWRWRSLWAAVGLHWGWNLSNSLLDSFITLNNNASTALLSSAAHLVLLAVILVWPAPRPKVSKQ